MKKVIFATVSGLLLSGCVLAVDTGAWDVRSSDHSSLTIRMDDGTERTISCSDGQKAYAEGGDGKSLVLGCRDGYADGE
ncbi:MAG: hypothetical protein COB37_11810 [Kordiimonadales bacterium]|nr:MAG: hypothetical protein COB37_11810 [Kordiimonadales bacterium]